MATFLAQVLNLSPIADQDHGRDSAPDDIVAYGEVNGRIAAGLYHSCAIGLDDTITCWGSDYSGKTDTPVGKYK